MSRNKKRRKIFLKEVRAFAPATVTNVGCGFDILGFALKYPGDEVVVRYSDKTGISIKKITGENGNLSKVIEENTAGLAVKHLLNEIGFDKGIEIDVHKKMGLGTGLGSSAASAVAAVVAADHLLGTKFSKKDLLKFALEGEKLTSGGRSHGDNVAASLFGGFIIVRNIDELDIINIDYPDNLYCVIIHPYIVMNTAEMRKLLGDEIKLADAVKQWGNIASLVTGLIKKDYNLISRSLKDFIVEPIRAPFIPSFYEIQVAAINGGAIGCSISGSGPSIFALAKSSAKAKKVAGEMKKVLNKSGIKSDIFISKINKTGPRILSAR
jgi:homoserine kinase